MENFNFYTFLLNQGYSKDVIRKGNGQTFCTNYQKEVSDKIWNSLTVHENKTITGASASAGIVFKEIPQPKTIEDAEVLIKKIEEYVPLVEK